MADSASGKDAAPGTRFGESAVDSGAASADRAGRLRAGSVIEGKYRLERVLGEGGMGAVWCAQHLQLDLPVAIKLLRAGPDLALLGERFKIEARAAAQLVHPAIVRVFDIDTTEQGEPFIVMELLRGESLSDLLDRGRLSGVTAVQTLLPIAEALVLAHGKGIVHRDLKPPNVFLAEEDERLQPKLVDFGIAKLTSAAEAAGSLTVTGVPLGSPDYMSPEQARGSHDVDHRADIWSFSVLLYEAISGNTPFGGDNYNALMRAIVEDEPAPLHLDANIDQPLAELILWGLAKDRAKRPSSMQELGRELARWLLDHGFKEDVCGTPLGPKWITRTAQKSVPVLQANDADEPPPPKAPAIVRTDTLVSPRPAKRAAPEPAEVSDLTREPARRGPLLTVAAVLIGLGVVWAMARPPTPQAPAAHGPGAPGPSAPVAPAASPPLLPAPVSPAAAPIEIASSVPSPSPATSALPPPGNVKSAPLEPVPVKPRAASSQSETPKPASATKPGRDGHHGERELLQAY